MDSVFTTAAQYNNPFENPVSGICVAIDEEAKKKSDVIKQVVAGIIAYLGERPCYDVYEFAYYNDPLNQYVWQVLLFFSFYVKLTFGYPI